MAEDLSAGDDVTVTTRFSVHVPLPNQPDFRKDMAAESDYYVH